MAKVRVITLLDQLKDIVKTLHKASTFHADSREELDSVVCPTPDKELSTIDNLFTHIHASHCTAQTLEQANVSNAQLIFTGSFPVFGQNVAALGNVSYTHEDTL